MTQTDLHIRPYDDADGPEVLRVHLAAIDAIDPRYADDTAKAAWRAGRSAAEYGEMQAAGCEHRVAMAGGRIVGFVAWRAGGAAELAGLYVCPEHQGRRIGQALLAHAEQALFEGRAGRIALASSANARGFFAACGYVETGRGQHPLRGGVTLDTVLMEKTRSALRPDGTPWRNFYGRRLGKKLRPAQQRDMDGALREIEPVGVTRADNPDRLPLDLPALFGDDRPVWLEIGFGAGEHMFHQARLNPEVGIIGCEPFINGVAQFMSKMRDAGVSNVRVHPGDARDLLEVLPQASLDRVFLLYPDPWPKTRHHRRRFVVPENLVAVARALRPGGIFRVATDIPDYVRQTLEVTRPMPEFEWLAEGPSDWREPWPDWTRTRYEAKAIREDRVPHYLTFRRV